MDVPPRTDLDALSLALDRPDADLRASLDDLVRDVRGAVGSFVGLSVTLVTQGLPFTVTVRDQPGRPVGASLWLPLSVLARADRTDADGSTGGLVLYATAPGAFVDLAADLGFALGVDPATCVLDAHLDPPDPAAASGLGDIAAVNQAIGALLVTGLTPLAARAELDRRAEASGEGLRAAAEALLAAIPPRPGAA